ncbi:hypothetical protein GALL_544530 [mine drainage metagenome]|uniref:Uncharacterized protein n=1 Tax=mine drainage metagenome TaxID=410659 RepID=A0A1J5P871_9ZZZZ
MQPIDHACDIGSGAVLAHFDFAFQPINGQRDADNAAQHALNEIGRRVGNRPRLRARRLVPPGQPGYHVQQPDGIVEDLQRAISVDRGVVPGRHDLAVLLLGGVVRRRDVAVRPLEDRQSLHAVQRRARMGIGLRQMPVQRAKQAGVRVQHQRSMTGDHPIRRHRHQRHEAARSDQIVQDFDAVFIEVGGNVHGSGLCCIVAAVFAGESDETEGTIPPIPIGPIL